MRLGACYYAFAYYKDARARLRDKKNKKGSGRSRVCPRPFTMRIREQQRGCAGRSWRPFRCCERRSRERSLTQDGTRHQNPEVCIITDVHCVVIGLF